MSAHQETGSSSIARSTVWRARAVIAAASVAFLALTGVIAAAGRFYYIHATQAEHAFVEVISGSGALWRDRHSDDWTLIEGRVEIGEGDEVSTTLGTTVWVTFFDGTTAEISEDSVVRFERMRSSRYVERTKEIVLEPERGLLSVAMASRGRAEYAEILVRTEHGNVVMSDEPGRPDGGAFVVEIVPIGVHGDETTHSIRAAAFRGAIFVQSGGENMRIESGNQVVITGPGEVGEMTGIVRSLILNGDFREGLAGWEVFHLAEARESPGTGGAVVLTEAPNGAPAVSITRPEEARVAARTGLRQDVKKTLRPSSTLELSFEIMIERQGPPAVDQATVPLVVEIEYLDAQGEEHAWSTGYWLNPTSGLDVPATTVSQVSANDWTQVIFDLSNLEPSARHIERVIVYASGTSYHSSIANILLTSKEANPVSP